MRTSLVFCGALFLLFCGGAVAAEPAPHPHEPAKKVTRYTATVTSDADGKIVNINLRGDGLPAKGIDLKSDTKAYFGKLKELAAEHDGKTKPAAVSIEIDLRLLQAHVVDLVDASIRAGVTDVSAIPLDKSKP